MVTPDFLAFIILFRALLNLLLIFSNVFFAASPKTKQYLDIIIIINI